MTSTSAAANNPYGATTSKTWSYDVRVEATKADASGSVPVAQIFIELREAGEKAGVKFTDTAGHPFPANDEITPESFISASKMEKVEHKNSAKVVFGFSVESSHTFNELLQHVWPVKLRRDRGLWIHQHSTGFEHGVNPYFLGHRIKFHPTFGDMEALADELSRDFGVVYQHMKESMPSNEISEWNDIMLALQEAKLFEEVDGEYMLWAPVGVERGRISGHHDGVQFSEPGCSIYLARPHAEMLSAVVEYGLLHTEQCGLVFENLILFGLSRDDLALYYRKLAGHAEWMHEHRNFPIDALTVADFNRPEIRLDDDPDTLWSLHMLLERKAPQVMAIHHFGRLQTPGKLNLSVQAKHFDALQKLCDQFLPKFSFTPRRSSWAARGSVYGGSRRGGSSAKTGKYSKMYSQLRASDDNSFDGSTIATSRTNHWQRGPPKMNVVIDFSKSSEFPALTETIGRKQSAGSVRHSEPPDVEVHSNVSDHSAITQLTHANRALTEKLQETEKAIKDIRDSHTKEVAELQQAHTEEVRTLKKEMQTSQADINSKFAEQSKQLATILQMLTNQDVDIQSPPRKRTATEPSTPLTSNVSYSTADTTMTEAITESTRPSASRSSLPAAGESSVAINPGPSTPRAALEK